MQFYRTLGQQIEDSATRAGARAIEQRAERGQALQTVSYEDALRDKVIVGTPNSVAARLQDLIAQARPQRRPGGAQLRRPHRR